MRALMKMKHGEGNVEIKNIKELTCEKEEVKINVKYSGICGTDLHIYHDLFTNYPPVVLGHEFSGIVTEIGPHVKNIMLGDRVTVLPSTAITCGKCDYCRRGFYAFCEGRKGMGYGVNGSFTQNVVVREDMVYKIPDHISMEVAALSEPLACVIQALEELETPKAGDVVLISGPGPIGLMSLSLLISRGVKVIVAGTNVDDNRLQLAKQLGAHSVVDVTKKNLTDFILKETNNKGIDIAVESAGHPNSVNACLKSLKKQGKLIQLGIIGEEANILYDLILYKQIKVQGSVAHSLSTWTKVLKMFEQNYLEIDKVITHKFPLTEWEKAFEVCFNKQGGKVLLYYN